MKVLLVNGSPHQKGCTFTALSEVAAALNAEGIETDFYWIGNKPIGGCIGCYQCTKKQKCVFDREAVKCRQTRSKLSNLYTFLAADSEQEKSEKSLDVTIDITTRTCYTVIKMKH